MLSSLMSVVLLAVKLFIRDTSEEVLIVFMLFGMLFFFWIFRIITF